MMIAERGAAANTLESYRRDLEDFSVFTAGRKRAVENASQTHIRGYLKRLSEAGMAPGTSARRLSTLRQFFRFLHQERVRDDDPTAALDSPRQGRRLPKCLSEEEVKRLLETAHARTGPEGLRLVAMLEILYATGLRVSELVGLSLSALSRDGRMLVVRGKGDKERLVPLSEPATDALDAYLAVREGYVPGRRQGAATGQLFPSRAKQGFLTRPASRNAE